MISKVCIVSIYFLYEKINYTRNLIGSLIDGRVDDNTIDNILLLYHMKHTASMLPWICTVIDHRKCQTVARTSISGHAFSAAPCVPLFSSSRILIKHWTDSRQIGTHLLIYKHDMTFNSIEFISFSPGEGHGDPNLSVSRLPSTIRDTHCHQQHLSSY